jgi:hypothetical protein
MERKSFHCLEPCQKGRKEELMWDPYAKTFPSSYERKVGIDDVIQEKDNIALAFDKPHMHFFKCLHF